MKVPYSEEIANHTDPESCGNCGNTVASGEDVDRGKHRRAIELRKHHQSGADPVDLKGKAIFSIAL